MNIRHIRSTVARSKITMTTSLLDSQALAGELKGEIKGEVRFDDGSRALYATDGSPTCLDRQFLDAW